MTDRVDFEIDCPNNHNQTVTFSQNEFEDTLKAGDGLCNEEATRIGRLPGRTSPDSGGNLRNRRASRAGARLL